MTTFLTDADVRAAFNWPDAIAALRAAYAAVPDDARFPARTMARGEGMWLRTLSGVPGGGGPMGAKLIAASLRSRRASYLIPLFDQDTTELLALLDGHSITGFRTAATSALAADLLAPAGTLRVGVIGSGFEAQNHVRALAAIRDLSSVTVFSPNPASRTRFAESGSTWPGKRCCRRSRSTRCSRDDGRRRHHAVRPAERIREGISAADRCLRCYACPRERFRFPAGTLHLRPSVISRHAPVVDAGHRSVIGPALLARLCLLHYR